MTISNEAPKCESGALLRTHEVLGAELAGWESLLVMWTCDIKELLICSPLQLIYGQASLDWILLAMKNVAVKSSNLNLEFCIINYMYICMFANGRLYIDINASLQKQKRYENHPKFNCLTNFNANFSWFGLIIYFHSRFFNYVVFSMLLLWKFNFMIFMYLSQRLTQLRITYNHVYIYLYVHTYVLL